MERDLNNKIVVITGAAEGIGFAIAESFLQHGAFVVVLDVNDIKGTEATETLNIKYDGERAVFIKCDVTKDLESVYKTIIDKYKNVDILVNNAGILNEKDAKKTLEINAIAVIDWTVKFREHMRMDDGGNGGTIINIASIYGFMIDPYLVFYKASKFAVMGFTRCLGHEDNYKRSGVRIVAICPGFTHSSLTTKPLSWDEHKEGFELFTKNMPWQSIDAVGKAAVDVFKTADSGTAWVINGGEAIEAAP